MIVTVAVKLTVGGRRFEAVGANPPAAWTTGLHVMRHRAGAYVWAQVLYWLAGVLLAGIIAQPTAFQGDAYLLPSVAAVVLGGTSLLGGRGFLVATAVAALFLSQLEQFVLALGVDFRRPHLWSRPARSPSVSPSTSSTGGLSNSGWSMPHQRRRPVPAPSRKHLTGRHNRSVLDNTRRREKGNLNDPTAFARTLGCGRRRGGPRARRMWRRLRRSFGEPTVRQRLRRRQRRLPAWCGDKEIVLGMTDGFGGNSWRLVTTASGKDEAAKCPSVKEFLYADGQGNTQKAISDIQGMVAKGVDALVVFPDAGRGDAARPALGIRGRRRHGSLPGIPRRRGRQGLHEYIALDSLNDGRTGRTGSRKCCPTAAMSSS